MQLIKSKTQTQVISRHYSLTFYNKGNKAYFSIPRKRFYYALSLLGACNTVGKLDVTKNISRLGFKKKTGVIFASFEETSSLWLKKTHVITMSENDIIHTITVKGRGNVDKLYFFRGFSGECEYGSAPGFDRIFSAAPNFHERAYFHPSERVAIDQYITPFAGGTCLASPYCFFGLNDSREKQWVGVGPAARPGQNLFESFEMNPEHRIQQTPWAPDNMLGGGFSLVYSGNLRIDGEYTFPELLITFGDSEWQALERHVGYQKRNKLIPAAKLKIPRKWLEPIFCGWHEQGACIDFGQNRDDQVTSLSDICTEANHEKWLALLEKNDLKPGTIIIDASWQKNTVDNIADESKFPDLRGFIDKCHARNQLVLLWMVLWNEKDLIEDECIKRDGKALRFDPTNPKYEKRVRAFVKRMISSEPGCYNADGIKIDGMLQAPNGKKLEVHGNIYGLELQKKFLSIIHDEVKSHKKDGIVSVFSAHPYLRDVIDMVRIGDMYTVKASCEDTMVHRAKIYKSLMPDVPIDSDGQFGHNILDKWIDIFETQARIGIPTLYCCEYAKRQRFFTDAIVNKFSKNDYAYLAGIVKKYRARLGRA